MLWKRKPDVAPEATATSSARQAEPAAPTEDSDAALSAAADLVRTFGQHAFDTDEIEATELARQCDTWVRELLVSFSVDEAGKPRRNWSGLRHFVRKARQNEAVYVTRSMGNLKEAIQTFAQCLTVAVHEDRQTDESVEQNLSGLIDVLSSNKDTEKVREEVLAVVGRVRNAMDKRRKREERQMELLSRRLRNLRSELTEAKVAASIDSLTKLSNRQAFDAQVQRLRDLGLLFSCPPCLLMIDVDHFKLINDTYGHPGGDLVLQEVSRCLLRTFLRKQDFVARFGGEEFAVLLVDTDVGSALALAERARATVQQKTITYGEQQISVTMSIGVAALSPGESTNDWLKRADEALYQAKASGRNCLRCAQGEGSPGSVEPGQVRTSGQRDARASG